VLSIIGYKDEDDAVRIAKRQASGWQATSPQVTLSVRQAGFPAIPRNGQRQTSTAHPTKRAATFGGIQAVGMAANGPLRTFDEFPEGPRLWMGAPEAVGAIEHPPSW